MKKQSESFFLRKEIFCWERESINDPSHCPIAFPEEHVSRHPNTGQGSTIHDLQFAFGSGEPAGGRE